MDIELAEKHATSLMQDAAQGFYRIDEERVDPGIIGCILAEFLDRLAPEAGPFAWSGGRAGYRFGRPVSDS